MRKTEVGQYREHGMQRLPSINVKIGHRQFAPNLTKELLNCDDDIFEKATTYAFETVQERFWKEAQDIAEHHFAHLHRAGKVKVYSAGRSGGHLIVDGLPPVEEWNAIEVSAWGRFCNEVQDNIAYHCQSDTILENILSNRWNEEGAEPYNFIEGEYGKIICKSAMKAEARAAGFGPVIRA